MNYTSELRKFISSQYIYSGVRITLAIVVPSLILAHFGLLKEYFLFPLGTSFIGLTDQPGPFIRRRNSLIAAVISFFLVAAVSGLIKDVPALVFPVIILFGMFFTMIGVYGQRLAAVGSLSLVVMGIFVDGNFAGTNILKSLLIFLAGCSWFVVIFLIVSTIRPYKLASQMIGENYLELAKFLKIKSGFYHKNPDYNNLISQLLAQQVKIKNLQEETRETVFRTRTIVNESTTTSRLLMLMFLNSIDLHEKLLTSENDYRKLHENFQETRILSHIHNYLNLLSEEISRIGIALQSSVKAKPSINLDRELNHVYDEYFKIRNRHLNSETLEHFLILRQILMRISEVSEEIKSIFVIDGQDLKAAKSLSTRLDYQKFLSAEEHLNFKVLRNNLSLDSALFKHSIRITIALLIGYLVPQISFLGIGHPYWILITITAIMKPSFSITKSRNLLRLYGTIAGAVLAYLLLMTVDNNTALLMILLGSMILCFSFLREKYFWAVLFMTIYIFLSFNFLNPGNINLIFKDRILDTTIAGIICFLVAYFVFPVWEHTQTLDLMKKSAKSSKEYFTIVTDYFTDEKPGIQQYKLKRKEALINLANLSDNFQRMISDPKSRQKKKEAVHQFVNTTHLLIAYTASLSQYKDENDFPEIDFESWNRKIINEITRTQYTLNQQDVDKSLQKTSSIEPDDHVETLLRKRKSEIDDNLFFDRRDTQRISRLTTLKNIQELLVLIYDVAREQRKVVENYYKINPQS
ncbi:MAG: FUSC family membrane protein [Bergeyella sp.]